MWVRVFMIFAGICCATGGGGVLLINGESYTSSDIFLYYDGKPANCTCKTDPPGKVKLSYKPKRLIQDGEWTTGYVEGITNMYLQLTPHNNDTHLYCSLTDKDQNNTDIIGIHFIITQYQAEERFTVNRKVPLLIGVHGSEVNSTREYEYRYIRDEKLVLAMVRKAGVHRKAYCDVKGTNVPAEWLDRFKDKSFSRTEVFQTSLKEDQSGTMLRCGLYYYAFPELSGPLLKVVNLEVKFTFYNLDPFIGGLSMSRMLCMYRYERALHLTYDYDPDHTGNETLYVTCDSDADRYPPPVKNFWIFWPPAVDLNAGSYPTRLTMKREYNHTNIRCIRKSNDDVSTERVLSFNLLRRSSIDKTLPSATLGPLSQDKGKQATQQTGEQHESSGIGNWNMMWIALGLYAVAMVAAGLALILYGGRKGKSVTEDLIDLHPQGRSDGNHYSLNPEYETISLRTATFSSTLSLPTAPPPALPPPNPFIGRDGEPVPDNIRFRPQLPLPPECLEEIRRLRYRPYDIPYESRIFRHGDAKCQCGRCKGLPELPRQHL